MRAIDQQTLISQFNLTFGCELKVVFLNAECTFSCSECLIVVVKLSNDSYATIESVNHYMLASVLLVEPKAKIELKKICSAYLKYEIDKNIFANTAGDNQNLKVFLSRVSDYESFERISDTVTILDRIWTRLPSLLFSNSTLPAPTAKSMPLHLSPFIEQSTNTLVP